MSFAPTGNHCSIEEDIYYAKRSAARKFVRSQEAILNEYGCEQKTPRKKNKKINRGRKAVAQHTQPKSIVSFIKNVELTNLDNIFVQADLSRKHNAIGPV
jgi:hypothetical protein